MSLSSRSRNLARRANITYQQAHAAIVASGEQPAKICEEKQWPLSRADVYLFDPDLDDEVAAAYAAGSRYVSESVCDNCNTTYFRGSDKKGIPTFGSDRHCRDCVAQHGEAECSRCGRGLLGLDDLVCSDCWMNVISND